MALPAPPFGSSKDTDKYGIKASLRVFLRGGEVNEKSIAIGSRLERLIRGKQRIEKLRGNEFIENATLFLESIQTTEILLITINSKNVYRAHGEEQQKDSINQDGNLERILLTLNLKSTLIEQVTIVAKCKNDDFEFQSELVFERLHRARVAGILLKVSAIPRELVKRPEESRFDWISR